MTIHIPTSAYCEELRAAYSRIDELENDLTQWVRQAEDNSGEAQRYYIRIQELRKALAYMRPWRQPESMFHVAREALEWDGKGELS